MKKEYWIVHDDFCCSHIATRSGAREDRGPFSTFSAAKKQMIGDLLSTKAFVQQAINRARILRLSDITED